MTKKTKKPSFEEKRAALEIAHLKRTIAALEQINSLDGYLVVPDILQLALKVTGIDWVWLLHRSALFCSFESYQEAQQMLSRLLEGTDRATWLNSSEQVANFRDSCVSEIKLRLENLQQVHVTWGDRLDDFEVTFDGEDVVIQEIDLWGEFVGEIARF